MPACPRSSHGTPVNRIPIMAKQVLDLYELYRLVVSRGGLVEVINKKIWREITKGLNLPSSITSAAFTLRTQYMKYLYPYECEKEKLSQPDELQAAIDGNRREGRRSSYSHYAEMMSTATAGVALGIPQQQPSPIAHQPRLPASERTRAATYAAPCGRTTISCSLKTGVKPAYLVYAANSAVSVHVLGKHWARKRPLPLIDDLPMFAALLCKRDAWRRLLVMAVTRLMEQRLAPLDGGDEENSLSLYVPQQEALNLEVPRGGSGDHKVLDPRRLLGESLGPPPSKRFISADEDHLLAQSMHTTHIKMNSRGDGRNQADNTMSVTMEVNGIIYHGVLYPQPHRSRLS
ncbi:hypothetical protein HPB50_016514 [Hyalomma asiaticum]|uniref:Uncharacterized protein n=1 Tax=Hyalomma asiaticum TaxID=266040 RepID=A0ACB7SYZ1_HYAAI|nr:hypothetical protein HPB50_016514 [Hyalomma asiaticum]